MKLIIYLLTIIIILPLCYLWIWKKSQRLILGLLITIITIIALFIPDELTYSIIAKEIEQEIKTKEQITDNIIEKVASEEINSENSEKVKQAKKISDLNKQIKIEKNKELLIYYKRGLKKDWINKWKSGEYFSTLLFCGQEFMDKLNSREYEKNFYGIKEKIAPWKIIDFNSQNDKPEVFQNKIWEILKRIETEEFYKEFSIIVFQNIDKINPKLENLFLEIFKSKSQNNIWKFKDKDNKEISPNLLKIIFIGATSHSNPETKKIYQNFNHIEPFLDKHFWIILMLSIGVEIITFVMLIKNKKKSQNKNFNKFDS